MYNIYLFLTIYTYSTCMHACMQDHLDWCALSSWLIIDMEDKVLWSLIVVVAFYWHITSLVRLTGHIWSLIVIDKTLAKAEAKLNETPHHSGLLCHDQTFPDRAPCQNHDHVISYQPATCAQQPGKGQQRQVHTYIPGPVGDLNKFLDK